MAPRRSPTIFIVSDGRGETANRVVQAAAVQFEGMRYRVARKAEVRTIREVIRSVEAAAKAKAVIFYTLVAEDSRKAMRRAASKRSVPTVDVLGPAFTALHELFKSKRGSTPGLLYDMERERADRMDAIEYTLKHDDGQRPHELSAADVVLVGVSRASKSSTCFYLAYQGIRAANVPLVPGVPLPSQVLRLPSAKVIGLRLNPSRLLSVREARALHLRLPETDPYINPRSVAREVLDADRLMEKRRWRSIDVSYLAIEEIAREVMSLRGFKRRPW
jgi:[pyruvate, water dikinase]-phosphate phosphotransferase / [pyruvate, water dikinase] kinase